MSKHFGLRDIAETLRKHGTGEDTVLAHINPAEAKMLKKNYGMSINEHTGLPQYGFFKSIAKPFKSLGKALIVKPTRQILHGVKRAPREIGRVAPKIAKTVIRVGAPIVGAIYGGPMGAAAGAAIANRLTGRPGHKLLKDMGVAGGLSYGWGAMGGLNGLGMGADGPGFLSNLSSRAGNFLNTGAGAAASATEPAALSALKNLGSVSSGGGGGLSSGMGGFLSNPLNLALAATIAHGAIKGRNNIPVPDEGPGINERFAQMQMGLNPPHQKARKIGAMQRNYIPPPEGYIPGVSPAHNYYDEVNPATKYMAHGGRVDGYLHGASGGQTDDRNATLEPGDYIMDATSISLLGDGNSLNGAKKTKELEDTFLRSGITKDESDREAHHLGFDSIPASLSDGEYKISRDAITALGNGSNRKGSIMMDKFRKNLRKQKGVVKFLPPKTKHLSTYFK